MSVREAERSAFLAAHGQADGPLVALPADASFRRYFRLAGSRPPVLLMDAPPPREDVRPFVRVAAHLAELGLSAPTVHAIDEAGGFVLLEDFGERTFTRLLAGGHDERSLYELAVDVLVHLHRDPRAAAVGVPAYDEQTLLDEAALFTDWYLPACLHEPCTPAVRAAWLDAWREVFAALPSVPDTLVLRDFHVDNLMALDARAGVRACGLLDFQDARLGPGAYDLVSLLEDARRDVAPDLRDHLLARYRAAWPAVDAGALAAWCAALGAQRHAKVAGIFVRLRERDGKPVYVRHLPRVLRLLAGALAHPALAPVRGWLDSALAGRLPAAEPAG